MRSALSLAAFAVAVTVLLSGCVPQDPAVIPAPEPSTEPVFASDEEALAAATDAYKAYLAMSDLIAQEGGKDPERIAPFVTEEWLDQEVHWSREFESREWRLLGNQNVTSTALQQVFSESAGVVVIIYACVDLGEISMLDAAGTVVTPPTLGDVLAQEVTFLSDVKKNLRVAGAELWTGAPSC